MLKKIVELINNSNSSIKDGTIFCKDHIILEKDCIEFLVTENILENDLYSTEIETKIDLELNLKRLNAVGYYDKCEDFIIKNKYSEPEILYYINELNFFSTESCDFSNNYKCILELISAITKVSKHSYDDSGIHKSIVFREDKSSFIPFIYNLPTVLNINDKELEKINSFSECLKEENSKKTVLFINELIDFLSGKIEENKFEYLISHFTEFYEKCNNAYQYYLSNFSYNKLKIELDSKALEFTQKIQTVINDSQTKLIAIPTAFIFVFAAFDYKNLMALKNIATIIGLFIFSILIQLFLNNQKSTLNFIWENIRSYKSSFNENNIDKISSKFSLVEKEFDKQKTRLKIVETILWTIPVVLFCMWIFLIEFELLYKILGIAIITILLILKLVINSHIFN